MESSPILARRYGLGAIALHWIIAVLVAVNYGLAWSAEDLPKPEAMQVIANHKAIGITILLLTVVRLVWRLVNPGPPLHESLKAWEAALAKVTHWLFYVALLAIPLAGWAMHSAGTGGMPVSIFGLFDFPALPFGKDRETAGMFGEMHEVLATLNLVLVALHLAGALKHIVIDRDGTMRRMLPW